MTFAFGGPHAYSGRDLRAAHAHMKLTEADFDALMENLGASLKELKVPDALAEAAGIAMSVKHHVRRQGYLLACVCRPKGDLEIEHRHASSTFECRVRRVSALAPDVYGVWLERPVELEFEPGQFIHVSRPSDGLSRPYPSRLRPRRTSSSSTCASFGKVA